MCAPAYVPNRRQARARCSEQVSMQQSSYTAGRQCTNAHWSRHLCQKKSKKGGDKGAPDAERRTCNTRSILEPSPPFPQRLCIAPFFFFPSLRLTPFQQASRSAKILGLILLPQALLPSSIWWGMLVSRTGTIGGSLRRLASLLHAVPPRLAASLPHIGAADTPGYVRLATSLPAAC